ncbi:MAG: nuclear transport factor 2 family protein [Rhodothermia bacterium]|nr:nuclear transport factor 2 family protein [Rhodothermia bacterium]
MPLDLSSGEDATEDVRRTIDLLFDGMREGDASKVRSAFADAAVMGRPRSESGVTTFEFRSVDEFAVAVGRPHEKIWNERIGAVEIRVDGHLASAWMEYAFYLGDDLHHCGVNSMQLVRFGSSWKIVALLDTDRGLACSEKLDS